MRQLPLTARVYLVTCYLLGLCALGWFVLGYRDQVPRVEDWLLGGGLAVVAAACQVFIVLRKGASERGDHLTQAPVFAALLLLPRPLLAPIIIFTFLPEWKIHRRKWYSVLFNIAAYAIAGLLVRLVLFHAIHNQFDNTLHLPAWGILLAIPLFLGTQTLLVTWILKFATGQSFKQSGMWAPHKLLTEVGIVCVGLAFALSWILDPLYGIAAALPLVLIFNALHVPNLKDEAATDPKTGLANMRHFNEVIARDLERAERSGQSLSVLMCDLDYLRNINNTHGHQAGDCVLLGVADIIRKHIRGSDVAARFGGEEFVVLLTDSDAAGAYQVAERLRAELEETRFDTGKHSTITATISIGVASYPRHGRNAEGLLHEADLAVYQAKRDGRNRVVVAGRTSRELAGAWAREHLVPVPIDVAASNDTGRPLWQFVKDATRTSSTVEPKRVASTSQTVTSDTKEPAKHRGKVLRRAGPPLRVLAFIGIVVAIGLLGLVPGLLTTNVPWWSLALFAALTVLAEHLAVNISTITTTSVTAIVILGATFLIGDLGILVMSLTFVVSIMTKARIPLHRMLFNFGTQSISAKGAALVFTVLVTTPMNTTPLVNMILPAVAAGLTFYALNHLLLSSVRGLSEQRNPLHIWLADYRWLWPHYAVFGALGLVVALAYIHLGWISVLAFMAPVAMMRVSLKQYVDRTTVYVEELRRMNTRLTDSYEATLQALSRALDTRDEETEEHSQRVTRYTRLIAQRLDIPPDELEDISRGALLHDIGKIGVPDAILLKPGKLDLEQLAIMRKHPEIGYGMIAHIPFLARAAHVVLHHHEAYDGSGYPSRLSGCNIPLGARIFAIADTFDAMTSDRPYRKALSVSTAIAEIERCSGTQFDPEIVNAFLAIPVTELAAVRANPAQPATHPQPTMIPNAHRVLAEAQAA